MDFVANQKDQIRDMLQIIGVSSVEELYKVIPETLILPRQENDDGMSEFEGMHLIEKIASKNTYPQFDNYLGLGAYEHHVPAMIGPVCSKSEFLTSYTPYQAEASQGMLQVIFEFQSAICALTGMDVANASVYDGASACAEALLMALRQQKEKRKVVIANPINPRYRGVIDQYLCNYILGDKMDEDTAAVLISYPNYYGEIEDIKSLVKEAHAVGALVILNANPLVYGLFASAGELDADIAVGDCQPFGLPLQYGGPYAGYIACRKELVRQLPGRIAGETIDVNGKKGYVLTLQAREQNIRREKATSNICSNQALAALASLVAILWYGKEGVKKLALSNFQRAEYLKRELLKIPGVSPYSSKPTFNEFAVRFPKNIVNQLRKEKIEPGVLIDEKTLLIAVTETKSKDKLDRFVEVVRVNL